MASAVHLRPGKRKRQPPRAELPIPNSTDQAVIATDLTGKVVFWNRTAEQMYGWSWQEAVGRNIQELLVPDAQQHDATKIMEQLRQGKSWAGRFKLRRRDGTEFIGMVTDQPMLDNEGNLIGIIGISRPEKTEHPRP